MSILPLILRLAAVQADFDHDGRSDQAYLRASSRGIELVVALATGEVVVIDRMKSAENFYFEKVQGGEYRTACSKELGSAAAPCKVPVVSVKGDVLQFGTREASRAVAISDKGTFQVHWLSD